MKAEVININKKNPDFQVFRWLLVALTDHPEEKRYHVIHLYVEDGVVVCTNGNRIHRYDSKNFEYQNGYYEVVLNSSSRIFLVRNENVDKEYPPMNDIFKPVDVEPFTVYADYDFEYSNVFAHILRRFGKNHLHYNYLRDLLMFGFHFDCYVGKERSPIIFIKEKLSAAIMPMAEPKIYK